VGLCLFQIGNDCGLSEEADKDGGAPPPICALFVTGGANHDHDLHQRILTAGIRQRLKRVVEWEVYHQGAGRSDVRIPLFENAAWAEGYDIVVHNHCFPRVADDEYTERILAPHREGLPAVLIHGALRSFSGEESAWRDFCGGAGKGVLVGPVEWKNRAGNDPILAGIWDWKTNAEELYRIKMLNPDITILAHGNIVGEVEKTHPVAWRHFYGEKKTRVFAVSLGNKAETMLENSYLDVLTRGFLWAVDSLDEETFKQVEAGTPVPGISLPEAPKVLQYPGVNLLTEARATAISCNVADDRMPSAAIDGDPVTYWESGAPGPVSFQVRWEAPTRISGLVVEWKDREPDTLQIEALQSEDQWKSLLFRAGRNDNQTTVMEIDQAAEVKGLRFSVPETRPAETIAIREIAAYQEAHRMPASYRVTGKRVSGLRSLSSSESGRKIRIRDGWTWDELGQLPEKQEPVQLIETARGDCFVLTRDAESKDVTVLLGRQSDGEDSFEFHSFLANLHPNASAAWDGEWLYVVQNGRIVAYRDTNKDCAADEKFGDGSLCFPEERNNDSKVPFSISRLSLSTDGWCYGLAHAEKPYHAFNSEGVPVTIPKHGLVRFRRDGSGLEVVWSSAQNIANYFVSDLLDVYVALGKAKSPLWYRLNALPGRFGVRENPTRFTRFAPQKEGEVADVFLARGKELALFSSANDSSPALVIAEIEIPFHSAAQIGGAHILAKEEGRWNLIHIAGGKAKRAPVDLDTVVNGTLPGLLDAPDLLLRHETLFELQRRRKDFTVELAGKLQNTDNPSYRGALSWFAQRPGNEAFRELVQAAQRNQSAFAFRLLGDRPEVRNHKIFGSITDVTSPKLSAAILSAILRSGTNVEGLTNLSLSLANSEEEEVAVAAKNFLIEREAEEVCFAVLDDPKKAALSSVAFEVLAKIPKPTVVEGIVLRLEQTGDPSIRRKGLNALCDLYHISGAAWQCTPLIRAMLNASLGDPRVDAVALLDAMKSRKIPIADKATLVARAKKEISLEPAAIQILLRNPQSSAGFSRWLFAIAQSKSRDTILRAEASSLLLPLNDIPFRDGFSLADQLLSCDLPQKDSQRLLRGFGKVEVPEREISSLLQRAKGSDENKAVLGWIVLIGLLERDDTSPSDIDRIRAALDDVSDGVALRALLKAATVKDVPEVESLLAKAAVSDLEETQKLAASLAGQIRRNMLAGQAGEKETREKRELAALAKKIAGVEADPEIGWHVFNREGCASCHNIQGEGPVSGPDIVSTATARTVQQFVNEVLSVTSGYGSHGFELKDGARIFGIVEDRTEEALSLRDTGGNRVSLPRDQVHLEWKSDEALMHSHYAQTISATELAAIRAYLRKLGGGK